MALSRLRANALGAPTAFHPHGKQATPANRQQGSSGEQALGTEGEPSTGHRDSNHTQGQIVSQSKGDTHVYVQSQHSQHERPGEQGYPKRSGSDRTTIKEVETPPRIPKSHLTQLNKSRKGKGGRAKTIACRVAT